MGARQLFESPEDIQKRYLGTTAGVRGEGFTEEVKTTGQTTSSQVSKRKSNLRVMKAASPAKKAKQNKAQKGKKQ